MTIQTTPERRFPDSGAYRSVDIDRPLMVATQRPRRSAWKHFAALLCILGLTMPGFEYGQTIDKPRLGFATDPVANGRPKTASAPMERLIDALAGEWSTEITYAPSEQIPHGGAGRSRDTYRVGPASSSLIEEYHAQGAGGKSWGTGVFWWDEQAKGFRFVWCDSSPIDAGCRVSSDLSNWNGDTFVVTDSHEVSGKPLFEREIWSGFAPNSFSQTLYIGDSRDTMKLYMTIKAKRVVEQSPSHDTTK